MVKKLLLLFSCVFLLCCCSFLVLSDSKRLGLSDADESSYSTDVILGPDESDTEASPAPDTESSYPVTDPSENSATEPDPSSENSLDTSNPESLTESRAESDLPESSAPIRDSSVPDTESNPSVPAPPDVIPPPPLTSPEALLDSMSLEELVGQMFLARCPRSGGETVLQTYHLGGYILFGSNFQDQTPDSIRSTLSRYQAASRIPMLIAVDEEGGTVVRVSRFSAFRSSPFSSPRDLYDEGGMDRIRTIEQEKAALLHSLGLNVNMAPVCDITTSPDSFMYDRSLGQSPEITAAFVETAIRAMDANQVGCVLKHFPGYGNNTDTHVGIAVDNRSLSELTAADLVPFQAGIRAGCGAILVSHTFIMDIDPDLPATLSPAVHQLLRNQMGFEGVIVTDDLAMGAITNLYGSGEAAVLAVQAGNDLLCSTYYDVQYEAVLGAVQSGRISLDSIRSSVLRILRWKQALGLLG